VLAVAVVVVAVLVAGGSSGDPTHDATSGSTTSPPTTPAATTSGPTTAPTVADLPPCRYAVLPAPDAHYRSWQRTLLDTTFALPQDYAPPNLVSVSEAGSSAGELVRSVVIPDLTALLQASAKAGNPVDVLIGYRSFARQQALFREHVRQFGYRQALAKTARPGHSEHQLGTTIDFRTKGQLDVPENWESQPAGRWMAANAWKFGFVMSYRRDAENVTCYAYEPWHYRYFGRAPAARIHASGLTPREFLWRMDAASTAPSGSPAA
jgi:D-alanyl-D-alanine carboxypeptidase